MPKFIVLIHASNFLFSAESEPVPHGAYTARVVMADDEAAAIEAAFADVAERIRTDADFVEDEAFEIRLETVLLRRVHGLRRVRGYGLVLYEQGDDEAEAEARAIAEEAAQLSSAN